MAQKKAALACSVCGSRNYTLTLGQNKRVERLELKNSVSFAINKHYIEKLNNREEQLRMRFLVNVVKEMKRVTWPTGKEVNKYTLTVVMAVLLALGFFTVVDFAISNAFKLIIK